MQQQSIQIGFQGSIGNHHVSPRELLSGLLCHLVCVEGIVTKCSLVQPKVVKSVHFCEATDKFLTREYRDATALDLGIDAGGRARNETSSTYPTVDEHGNPLDTEFGLCTYKDHQSLVIQEMPERAPLGQLPRSVELVLDYDLVDKVKPGDRVQCMGVYRAMANSMQGTTNGVFKSKVLCNNVDVLGQDVGGITYSPKDLENIKALGARDDVLDVLSRSFAPSICGHDKIKLALVLQLLGGCEKTTANGTHLRGDINVLMVGDPSTAKSQLLRFAMSVSPLAVSTTGRGSSGVGLTAAVTSDAETGERKLEAGAMVLADRGLVCIDEFDKMGEGDRVAIHEVMEQQTVTIAKAGIHASLNARCSVLAAANPVYGQYNKERRPQDNIGLPDSLLSRFDLLFVVLDQMDSETDRQISTHVLTGHCYRRPGTDMEPESLSAGMWDVCDTAGANADEDEDATPMWEKQAQKLLYGSKRAVSGGASKRRKAEDGSAEDAEKEGLLNKPFLKKFIHYAKNRVEPKLSDEAMAYIEGEYPALRAKAMETNRTLPVTARQVETLIRLATAYAKARLSDTIGESDAENAANLMKFALYHETGEEAAASGSAEEARASPSSVMDQDRRNNDDDLDDLEDDKAPSDAPQADEELVDQQPQSGGGEEESVEVEQGSPRYEAFAASVLQILNAAGDEDGVHVDTVMPQINTAGGQQYSRAEADAILRLMESENQVMYESDLIYLI